MWPRETIGTIYNPSLVSRSYQTSPFSSVWILAREERQLHLRVGRLEEISRHAIQQIVYATANQAWDHLFARLDLEWKLKQSALTPRT